MALSNPLFDDDIQSNSAVDPPNNEESTDVGELVNDLSQTETIFSSVRELLECPVCLNHMYPPIHQCSNGHTICPRCKPRVHNRCPTCRNKLGNIRCLALEKVAASFALPCEYMSLCIQAEVQDEVQAEISEYWPIQVDAGSFDQAPSWKQVLENRIVHRIVQHMENMIVSVIAKVTDKMEKMALAMVEDELVNMKDDLEKMIQAGVEDHLFAELSLAPPLPPPHHS